MHQTKHYSAVAVTLALLLSLGCASTYTQESTGEYMDNSIVTARVKTAIFYFGISRTDCPGLLLLVFAHFMTDDSTDRCTAESPHRATARKNGSADSTSTGTDGRVLFLVRHSGATAQTDQQ